MYIKICKYVYMNWYWWYRESKAQLSVSKCCAIRWKMCTSAGGMPPALKHSWVLCHKIKHVYQGVQGACPQQAVTSTRGMAEHQQVLHHRCGSKACLIYKGSTLTKEYIKGGWGLRFVRFVRLANITKPPLSLYTELHKRCLPRTAHTWHQQTNILLLNHHHHHDYPCPLYHLCHQQPPATTTGHANNNNNVTPHHQPNRWRMMADSDDLACCPDGDNACCHHRPHWIRWVTSLPVTFFHKQGSIHVMMCQQTTAKQWPHTMMTDRQGPGEQSVSPSPLLSLFTQEAGPTSPSVMWQTTTDKQRHNDDEWHLSFVIIYFMTMVSAPLSHVCPNPPICLTWIPGAMSLSATWQPNDEHIHCSLLHIWLCHGKYFIPTPPPLISLTQDPPTQPAEDKLPPYKTNQHHPLQLTNDSQHQQKEIDNISQGEQTHIPPITYVSNTESRCHVADSNMATKQQLSVVVV